jgi:ribosome-binding protein aMBF1 (putative translation factor)
MDHQDWNVVILRGKNNQHKTNEIIKKPINNGNKSAYKIEEDAENLKNHNLYGKEYGMRVAKGRLDKKLTQIELAKKMNVQPDIIKNIENGTGIVNGKHIDLIYKLLNVKKNI